MCFSSSFKGATDGSDFCLPTDFFKSDGCIWTHIIRPKKNEKSGADFWVSANKSDGSARSYGSDFLRRKSAPDFFEKIGTRFSDVCSYASVIRQKNIGSRQKSKNELNRSFQKSGGDFHLFSEHICSFWVMWPNRCKCNFQFWIIWSTIDVLIVIKNLIDFIFNIIYMRFSSHFQKQEKVQKIDYFMTLVIEKQ